MTTAINILATFRLVFNWLSRLRLAEFIVVTPLLESSLFRLTNLMVVLHVLQKKKKEKMYMISFFFFPFSCSQKKGPLSMFRLWWMAGSRIIWQLFIFLFFRQKRLTRISGALFTIKKLFRFSVKVVWEEVDKVNKDSVFSLHMQQLVTY